MTEPTYSRRDALRALGVVAGGGLAGCLAGPDAATGLDSDDLASLPDAIFRGDLERRGVHEDAEAPGTVERDWRVGGLNTGEHTAAKASPLAAPTGDIVVPGDNGMVYAVTPGGEVRWTADTRPTARGVHGTPAIANETVYVGAYDGALYAFDLESGATRWRTKLGDAIGASPVYHDGTVFIAVEYTTPDGSMFGVNAATGEVEWEDTRPTNHPHSSPAIDRETGTLVVGSNDGNLYGWSYPDLERSWVFETGGEIKGPIATHDGAAFFGSWDKNVYRVDLETGEGDWTFPTRHMVMSGASVDPRTDTVYIGSHDHHCYALDADTGEEVWRYDANGWLIGCPTVTTDHVLVGSYDQHLHAVERGTGEQVWTADATGLVTSTPLVHDGAVYYTDRATDETAGGLYRVSTPS